MLVIICHNSSRKLTQVLKETKENEGSQVLGVLASSKGMSFVRKR